MTVIRCFYAVVIVLALSSQLSAKGGSYHEEDRYNPQHINALPPEIRSSILHRCSDPKALHTFASYSDNLKTIVLHYEHFYCQGHDVFCKAFGCLHQLFILSGGRYRLERSYYAPN